MKLTIIESPYAGDIERNVNYAKQCMLDAVKRGETPFASHLLYTQILDDNIPEERETGIQLGMAIMKKADKVAVYIDNGISKGMEYGIKEAKKQNKIVEYRSVIMNQDYMANIDEEYQAMKEAGFDIILIDEDDELNGKIFYKEELKLYYGSYNRVNEALSDGIKHCKRLHQFVLEGTPEKMDEGNFTALIPQNHFNL